MKRFALIRWFNNISIAKKLYLVVGVMAVLILVELFALWFSMNTLSSIRALVGAEGLWSKSQKDAIYHLRRYGYDGDEKDYQAFHEVMKIPLGDSKARLELMKKNPNFSIAREGFLEGGNHPDDVDGMINVLIRFNKISYIDTAVSAWTEADPIIAKLIPISERLHKTINSPSPSKDSVSNIFQELDPINKKLTQLENKFSASLGEGSRWVESLILKILLAVAITVEVSGLLLTFSVSRRITKGINEVMRVSKEVAKGNFSAKAAVYSRDEIGSLAIAFNNMTDELRGNEEKIRDNEENYRTLVHSTTDLIHSISLDGKILFANAAWLEKLGYSINELKNLTINDILAPQHQEECLNIFQQVIIDQKSRNIETELVSKHGEIIIVSGNINCKTVEGKPYAIQCFLRDVTERKKAEEDLKNKTTQLIEAQALAHIGSWEWDVLANRITWSDELFRIFGLMPQEFEATYEAYLKYIHPDEREYVDSYIQKALKDHQPFTFYHKTLHKNGTIRIVNGRGTVTTGVNGKVIRMSGTAQDVTEIKKAEEAIIAAKRSAEESSLLKETFLANMSHEIRTPMNAIMGFADILSKRNLGEKEKEYVETIKSAGEKLLTIINDILDLSKMEAGMMDFEEHLFSIKELFKSLNVMLMGTAKEKNIELVFTCDDNVPDTLLGDPSRLTQIIINLVGNAIKFTQKGKVQVAAKVIKNDPDNPNCSGPKNDTLVEFSVTDTGMGIPEDKLEYIFERFRQADFNIKREYGGTGLGLSIAKQLVELQGGTLSVKSKVNKGSIFSFCVPYKKSEEVLQVVENVEKKYDMEKLGRLNILLVEDNVLNIKLISNLFTDNHFKFQVAENGIECIEKLTANTTDIILMDMEMPVMNGYETTTVIRKQLKNNIPIIAMTAHAMAGEREKCLSLGMNDYISKPINPDHLFEKMFNAVPPSKLVKDIKEPIVDLSYLFDTASNKKDVIVELIDIFLKQIPEDLTVINEAVKKSDYLKIKQVSHRMKSTVSVMGIAVLVPVLQQMETLGAEAKEIEEIKKLSNRLVEKSSQALEELKKEKSKLLS